MLRVRGALAISLATLLACGHDASSPAGEAGSPAAGKSGAAGASSNDGSGGTGGASGNGAAAGSVGTLSESAAGASGDEGVGGTGGAAGDATAAGSGGPVPGIDSARGTASMLGRDHFLIGMGNDLDNNHDQDGAYTLGVTLDLHYAYLSGLQGEGGWPDWNADGTFVNILTDSAKRHGTVPMFTLYSMAAHGEDNVDVLVDDAFMGPYWNGAKLLFQRLGAFDDTAVVHLEPDFWAYAQQQSHSDASSLPAHVKSLAPDCKDQPDTLAGMGKCFVTLARKYAPKTLLGFHASMWADPDVQKIGTFLRSIGASDADLVVIDMLDRDAGCFEAHTDPNCQRSDGPWYWDETNATKPNFHDHFAWAKSISEATHKPILWWQLPFGVPSATSGGSAGMYRDNRVKYIFEHVDELIAAGGVGAVFGTGADHQTYITSDGGQFKTAVTKYFTAPTKL